MEKLELFLAVTILGCLLLGGEVTSFYVKKSMVPKSSREMEQAMDVRDTRDLGYQPSQLFGADDWQMDSQYPVLQDFFKRAADAADESSQYDLYPSPQKRYLCRKHFVYNPVKGRCQPTMLAFRKG